MAADLKIETVTEGNGAIASTGKRVSVHYKGMLSDGDVFDASRPQDKPFSFEIGAGQVISGWELGVSGMKVGEVRKLTIPPKLGYGARGVGDAIPPNATLVFEIELLDVSEPVTLGQANPEMFKRAQMNGTIIIDIRSEEPRTINAGPQKISTILASLTTKLTIHRKVINAITDPNPYNK